VLGGPRGRRHAFRPASVVNVSGMSFGALSATAVEALNRGCAQAGCLQNTGEGGRAAYRRLRAAPPTLAIGSGAPSSACRPVIAPGPAKVRCLITG
jgi:hypothetical protein